MSAVCRFAGCDRPRRTRGLCITHYGQWLTGGRKDEALHEIRPVGICSGPDCTTPARDLCKVHQQQLTRRGGDRDLLTRSGERLKPQPVMCSGPGCDREGRTRGLCETHLKQFRQRGDMALLTPIVTPTPKHSAPCPGPECDRMASVHGLCAAHYGQLRRRGDQSLLTPIGVHAPRKRPQVPCRFDACPYMANTRGLCSSHYKQLRLRDWDETRLTKLAPPTQSLKGAGKKDQAKAETAARRARRSAERANLPPGWFEPSIKRRSATRGGVSPDDFVTFGQTAMDPAAADTVRRMLARHGADDLAEMLGVAA